MTFNQFKEFIEDIQSFEKYIDDLNDLKIDISNTPIYTIFYNMVSRIEEKEFTASQIEWIDWWLYERVCMDSSINQAWDKEGNEIKLDTIEDIWNVINNKELND